MKTVQLSSLAKVFKDKEPNFDIYSFGSALKNERFCWQLAVSPECAAEEKLCVKAAGELADCIKLYLVKNIPSERPMYDDADSFMFETDRKEYPDLLLPIDGEITLKTGEWNSIWVECTGARKCGLNTVELELSANGEAVGGSVFFLDIIDCELPEQQLLYTNWFHNDCLCTWYKVEPFSDEYWRIVENYIKNAADHGVSLLLTPVFTPPLDTAVGGERPTVQLVGVKVTDEGYSFDFANFEKYTALAAKCGIKAFEISHLFTQWGAEHAPKIVADVNGEIKRIFGWETKATGKKYTEFLTAFAAAFDAEVTKLGIKEKCFMHVSDEPSKEHIKTYKKDAKLLHKLFEGYRFIDALSDIEYYRDGLVETPVCCENEADIFAPEVKNFWTYYCCGQVRKNVPNRMFAMPSQRNRVLGVLLYKYNAEGFLQWGHNFWYSQYSVKEINPFEVTAAGAAFPSGDAFMVYPGEDGKPLNSLRHKVFSDCIDDLRALRLLESLKGREYVLSLIERGLDVQLSFNDYPHEQEWLLNLRERINREIRFAVENN